MPRMCGIGLIRALMVLLMLGTAVVGGAAAQTNPEDELARVRQALHDAELAEITGEYQRAWEILLTADAITSEWDQVYSIEHWQVYEAISGVYNVFENYRVAQNNAGYALSGLQERFPGSDIAAELALSARWELMLAHFRTDDCATVGRLAEPLVLTPRRTPFHTRATGLAAICLGRIGSARAGAALAAALAQPGMDKALVEADWGHLLAENLRVLTAAGASATLRAQAAQRLVDLARRTSIAPHDRVYFYQTAGLAVAQADREAAGALFDAAARLLRPTEADGRLYLENRTYQAGLMAADGDPGGGIAMLRSAIAEFDAAAAQLQPDVALTEYALARLMRDDGERLAGQEMFRAAYMRVRRVLPVDAQITLAIRRAIDTSDPGFMSFVLAGELGSVALTRGPVTDMERRPDLAQVSAETTIGQADALLSTFLAGRYADMQASIPAGPEARLLSALSHALLGEQAGALAALELSGAIVEIDPAPNTRIELGQDDRSTFYGDGPSTSTPPWLRDLTRAIALQWGTTDRIEEGHAATERLLTQATSLPEDIGSVVLGLEIFYRYVIEDDANQDIALRAWRNGYDAARPKTAWDAFAAMLVLEAAYDVFDPADADELQALLLSDLIARPDLRFARDFLIFVRYYNGITAQIDEASLIELGVLVPRLLAAVPTGHTLTASTNLSYATALWAQGRESEAVNLYRTALDAYELNAYGRRDALLVLRSALAVALYRTGTLDAATLLSQSAFAPLAGGTDGLRPSMVMQVVANHAFIINDRTSARAAAEVMRPFADDAVFRGRLTPLEVFYMMTDYALYTAGNQRESAALKALTQADAALARAGDPGPDVMAQVFMRRAQVIRALSQSELAFDHMRNALEFMYDAQTGVARQRQTGTALVRPQERAIAMTFAAIAYDLAEQRR